MSTPPAARIAGVKMNRRAVRPPSADLFPCAWNGQDPILKERLFGLTGRKAITAKTSECYFYLDNTPTHPTYAYKYPQREFPYQRLVEETASGRV